MFSLQFEEAEEARLVIKTSSHDWIQSCFCHANLNRDSTQGRHCSEREEVVTASVNNDRRYDMQKQIRMLSSVQDLSRGNRTPISIQTPFRDTMFGLR